MQARRPAHATVCFGVVEHVVRVGEAEGKAAGGQRRSGWQRVGDTIGPDQRQTVLACGRTHGADRLVAGENRRARLRRRVVKNDAHGPGARGAAMLHPRHHLLSDVTALVEIDAVQAVHIGLVRKRVAIHEVEAAARHAHGDAMRVIGGAVDQLGADQVGDFLCEFRWNKDPPAQRCLRGIGERQIGLHGGIAVPCREHAETVREIFDRDLGAQFVEAELVGKALRQRPRAVDQEAAAMAGRCFGDQEIHRDLALRRQQRPEPAEARGEAASRPW